MNRHCPKLRSSCSRPQTGRHAARMPRPTSSHQARMGATCHSASSWIEENLDTGKVVGERSQGGSSWSSAYIYETETGAKYFVKTARGKDMSMFQGEALGLNAMHETNTVAVPKVFHVGHLTGPGSNGTFIVMEYLEMSGRCDQAELGRQLALMHLATPKDANAGSGRFGFPIDNTIGGTHQPNKWMDNWVDFFREQRLGHQLKLAGDSRLTKMGNQLLPQLEHFFEGAGEIRPCILHGDLWSGNIAAANGKPSIFDPACYYGHHEAEFGMSWCAGFNAAFWDAYHELIPRAPGFEERHKLYTLYHYLNHYNMFGEGYYSQCSGIMSTLLKKL